MKKTRFYTELAYVFGIFGLALGTALMAKADLGISMVVAPAFLLYMKLSTIWSFVTFGMAEYMLQACLLIIMVIVLRKFKVSYLFSFVTAIIYGFTLDACMKLTNHISVAYFGGHLVIYIIGLLFCTTGVAFIFRTYISPEVYELFVKEVSAKFNCNINNFKVGYDCTSCLIGIMLSFTFFGLFNFEGVKAGTIVCALINGKIIGFIGSILDKHLEFVNGLEIKKYF